MSFWIYLSVAAWQDGRHQAVSGRVFLFFFAHFLTSQVCQCVCGADLQEMPASLWYCGMVREPELGQLLGGALLGGAMMLLALWEWETGFFSLFPEFILASGEIFFCCVRRCFCAAEPDYAALCEGV